MTHSSFQLTVNDGERFAQSWLPAESMKALILLCHGIAEHSDRYGEIVQYLNNAGYGVYALDHLGHGRSPGQRCYIDHFDQFTDAVVALRQRAAADHPELPIFVLGHSMGGLIATTYTVRDREHLAGCLVSGPALLTSQPIPLLQKWVIQLLSKCFPSVGAIQLDASGISRDPEVLKAYQNDPMVHSGKLSARILSELLRASEQLQLDWPKVDLPLLAMHGGDDQLTSPEGSKWLVENSGSSDAELKIYPGLYHEIFNEKEKLQVFKTVVEWLEAH